MPLVLVACRKAHLLLQIPTHALQVDECVYAERAEHIRVAYA